jgi:hypothetical protein
MIRHATPARRKFAQNAISVLEYDRPMIFGYGPDPAERMVPWLKTNYAWRGIPRLFYARFKDEGWVHCLASQPNLVSADRIARDKNLQVLSAWFDPQEIRSYARFYKGGKLAGELVAAGKGDAPLEVVSLKSSAHPKTFLKQCKTAGQAIDSFFAALDAERRDLAVLETTGGLELQDSQGRSISIDELEEAGVTCHAPLTDAENPASARLRSAVEGGDLEAARQAIADGASLEFLPNVMLSPLSLVFDLAKVFDDRMPADWGGLAKLLVDAGAPINGYAWESPPICSVVHQTAKSEATVIKYLQTILALGGDVNALGRGAIKGSTALDMAVWFSFPEVVQFLINRGARLDIRNGGGFTPLKHAESMARHDGGAGAASDKEDVRRRARVVELLRQGPPRK